MTSTPRNDDDDDGDIHDKVERLSGLLQRFVNPGIVGSWSESDSRKMVYELFLRWPYLMRRINDGEIHNIEPHDISLIKHQIDDEKLIISNPRQFLAQFVTICIENISRRRSHQADMDGVCAEALGKFEYRILRRHESLEVLYTAIDKYRHSRLELRKLPISFLKVVNDYVTTEDEAPLRKQMEEDLRKVKFIGQFRLEPTKTVTIEVIAQHCINMVRRQNRELINLLDEKLESWISDGAIYQPWELSDPEISPRSRSRPSSQESAPWTEGDVLDLVSEGASDASMMDSNEGGLDVNTEED